MSGDILTVKTVKRVRSVRGSALVHIIFENSSRTANRKTCNLRNECSCSIQRYPI